MLVRLTFCLTVIRICLDRQTKKEIKLGIRHWKKALKGCLKFIRLDRDPKLEKRISRDKFGGGNVHHVLFTKTDTGYEIQLILFSPRHIIFCNSYYLKVIFINMEMYVVISNIMEAL